MGFIGKPLKPILFASRDCLFKTVCMSEGSHTTVFTAPHHSVHSAACPDLCRSKTSARSIQCSPGSTWLSAPIQCSPETTWLSAHAAYGCPNPPQHLHSWGGQTTLEEEQRWLVTACSWCCRISPACRLVLAPLLTTVAAIHINFVWGCTELICWQKLDIIADCYNASLYLILKGND